MTICYAGFGNGSISSALRFTSLGKSGNDGATTTSEQADDRSSG